MSGQETKKALTIVDKSTRGLSQAVASMKEIFPQVEQASKILTTLAGDIEFKQDALENLETAYANKVRALDAELDLQVKENKRKVLNTLLSEFKLAEISLEDLVDLRKDFEYAQREITKEINEAVNTAIAREKQIADSELKATISNHQVEIATYKAQADAKDNQIAVLTGQVADLRDQIDKDRDAHVRVAEARSNETTNVNVGK